MIFVGIPTDSKTIGPHPFQAVGEKYIRGLLDGANVQPVLIPSMHRGLDLDALLDHLDGLFLTGSPSNIEPHHYSDEASYEGNLHDSARDLTTLNLIPKAIAKGVPVLAVCRGFQEVIVAMGEKTAQTLLNSSESITNLRGKQHVLHGLPLIVTFSAAEMLEHLPNKAKAWHDLCTALRLVNA